MSFKTANQREAGGILDREATRNLSPYVLVSFLKPRITRMWQKKIDNSKIRDYNRDNREWRECGRYSIIRKFVIKIVTTANDRECVMFFCSYVLMS